MSVPTPPSNSTPANTPSGVQSIGAPVTITEAIGPDWTDQVTDLIVDVVDRVHDKTTGPLISAAKAFVYGTVAALVLPVVLVLLLILIGREMGILLDEYLWAGYLGLGVILVLGGFFAWSKRAPIGGSR